MSDHRIHKPYKNYDLIAAYRKGKYRGRIVKNKEIISDIEGSSLEDVHATLMKMVDDIISDKIDKRDDASPDAQGYIDDFKASINFKPITSRDHSETAFAIFREHFARGARVFPSHKIGFQGGGHECDVYWHGALGVWGLFEPSLAKGRYWICYGQQNPADKSMLTITVETNPPFEGVNRRCAGAFLRNDLGDTFIAHNGKVGGGRKGISQKAFRAYTQDMPWENVIWPNGDHSLYRVISRLDASDLPSKMAEFVHEVARFKEFVVSG
jgi:hypothetical protein